MLRLSTSTSLSDCASCNKASRACCRGCSLHQLAAPSFSSCSTILSALFSALLRLPLWPVAFIASQPAFASSVSKVSAICARGRPWLLPPLLQPQTRLMRHRISRPEQTFLQGQPLCCYCCKSCGLLTRLGSSAENGDALKRSPQFLCSFKGKTLFSALQVAAAAAVVASPAC